MQRKLYIALGSDAYSNLKILGRSWRKLQVRCSKKKSSHLSLTASI
jgi:hypothetical protein